MGVQAWRFPEFGVTMQLYRGVITPELLFHHMGLLEESDVIRWIGFLDTTSDFTQLDLATLSRFRRAGVARLRALGARDMLLAFVSPPGRNDQFIDVWNRLFQLDRELPGRAARFSNLKAACDWLGLPQAAYQALAAAVAAGEQETAPEGASSDRRS